MRRAGRRAEIRESMAPALPPMPSRLRYLAASAFVLLFWLIPSANTPSGRAYLAVLQVRAWRMMVQPEGND